MVCWDFDQEGTVQGVILGVLCLGVFLLSPSLAQAPSHPIIMTPVTYNDMTTTVLGVDMSFQAWVSPRPAEVLSESSPGSVVADGLLQFDVSAFTTPWAV